METVQEQPLWIPADAPGHDRARAAARRRSIRRWIRRVLLAMAALAIVAALIMAWRPRPIDVDLAVASRGDLTVSVLETGRARVHDRYAIAAPIAGELLRPEHRAGDAVAANAVVARIVPPAAPMLDPRARARAMAEYGASMAAERRAQATLAAAEVAALHAEHDLAPGRHLAAVGALAPDALADLEFSLRQRRAEVSAARAAVQAATQEAGAVSATLRSFEDAARGRPWEVIAPSGGRVLRVLQESAGPVQAGAALLEVGDPASLEVVADLLSADAVRVRPGAAVSIEDWGGPALRGHVRVVEPSAFTRVSALGVEEQRVPVVIDIDAPRAEWSSLGDGFRVEVRVVVEQRAAVIKVPIGAVFRSGAGWAAYLVGPDGRARRAPLDVGARSDAEVEVISGLRPDDRVVVHPSERVTDGVRVAAR